MGGPPPEAASLILCLGTLALPGTYSAFEGPAASRAPQASPALAEGSESEQRPSLCLPRLPPPSPAPGTEAPGP